MPIEVELPDGSIAEFPDGTGNDVIKGALQKRFGAPQSAPKVDPATNQPQPAQDTRPWYAQAGQAADDLARLFANGLTFGYADKLAGYMNGDGAEAEHKLSQQASERAGGAGTVAELGGAIATPVGLAGRGITLAGRFGTGALAGAKGLAARTGLMGLEGAGYGGLTAAGNDEDIAAGAGLGLIGGIGGNLAGEGLSTIGQKASKAWRIARATPEERAAGQVYDAAQRVGATDAVQRLNELGPEAMAVDVLGKRGMALGRNAANISPEARELLEASVLGRKAGQNVRLASDVERAGGLPAGNRQGVDALKRDAYNQAAPEINAAYDAARAAGADLPREPFRAILETPMGRQAYEGAADSLLNRNATQGFKANSELARLDETKRILDSKASAAYRAGDNNTGEQASALARSLRETMDNSIAGPEYAAARGLRQKAFQTDRAFDLGADLARPNVPLGLPGQASNVSNAEAMRKAYAASIAERLLNKNATEGALNSLSTPMAKEAMDAALGENASTVTNAMARERAFNQAARELTGNSTTARQIAEMLGTGVGIGGASMLFGADPFTSGVAGVGAVLMKRGAPALAKKIATDAQRKSAPYVADYLTRRALPASRPIPEGALERLSKAKRDAIARMIMGGGINAAVTP